MAQTTIATTICSRGYTATVRPPVSFTEPLKLRMMADYGYYAGRSAAAYELDHLIPLELGGAPADPRNLWPQAIADAHKKDQAETAANRAVCSGRLALAEAQQTIAHDWRALGQLLGGL